HRGEFPTVRPAKVDELSPRQVELQDSLGLGVDRVPRLAEDRREGTLEQILRHAHPRRLPMASEPSSGGAVFTSPFSISVISPSVKRYVCALRAKIASRRRSHSSVIIACSISSFLLCRSTAFSDASAVTSARCWYQSIASSSSINE